MRRLSAAMVAVELTAAIILAGVTALTFVSVILRYLFTWPVPDQYDVSRLFLGILIAWGIATCTARNTHIDVDILWSALPPAGRRVVDVLSISISLLFLGVTAYEMLVRTLDVVRTQERTFDLGLPIWPWYAMAGLGIAAATLAAGLRLVLAVRRGRDGAA